MNGKAPKVRGDGVAAGVAQFERASGLTRTVFGRFLEDWRCIMSQRKALDWDAKAALDAVVLAYSGSDDQPHATALVDLAKTIIDTTPVTEATVKVIAGQLKRFGGSEADKLELAKAVGEMIDRSGREVRPDARLALVELSLPRTARAIAA